MRNKGWYLMMLKGKTMEWAYAYITENLKRPSFIYEPQNAYAAYKEIFGVDFASPEERKTLSQAEEIERLKKELELAKIAQNQVVTQPIKKVDGQSELGPDADDKSDKVDLLTKEQFKSSHPELKGLPLHHAYQKYLKENQVK
jgi:hypothetical protein